MKYNHLLLAFVLVFSLQAKANSRGFVERYLGMKAADFIFGDEVDEKITLPEIPKVQRKNTDSKVYDKSSQLDNQGKDFNDLSEDKKTPYRLAYIRELIKVTRNIDEIQEEELGTIYNSLSQGASREGIYRSLVLDSSYAAMESLERPPSEALLDFAVDFAATFLNKNYKKESLGKVNLFTIKRVLTEDALEIMDALKPQADDVYRWYAVFSADMAKNYHQLWSGKLRKNKSAKKHHSWAQRVPFQHIKSEFILKIHAVLNHLESQL